MYCVPCAAALLGDDGSFDASVEQWRGLVSRHAGDLPVNFLLAWLQRESGGNVCSYTKLRESGIFQLMPPDNTNTAGTTEAALRPACSGQTRTRQFTPAELELQVVTGIRYVNAMRAAAAKKLAAAGVTWDERNPDFWRVVKLQHAYPGPTAGWLGAARMMLGRPVRSWAELRSTISGYSSVLDNAEWVGGFGAGGGSGASSTAKLVLLLGGLGLLAAMASRYARH